VPHWRFRGTVHAISGLSHDQHTLSINLPSSGQG